MQRDSVLRTSVAHNSPPARDSVITFTPSLAYVNDLFCHARIALVMCQSPLAAVTIMFRPLIVTAVVTRCAAFVASKTVAQGLAKVQK
eukprot:6311037-Amphidinium_carterae.1